MDISQITQIISLILAVSLASERLVTLLKTLIPWLADPQVLPSNGVDVADKKRKIAVMGITFLVAWITASFLKLPFNPFGFITLKTDPDVKVYFVFIGFLASGGSAFWSGLLGYTNAVKNLKTQQLINEKLALKSQLFTESPGFAASEKRSGRVHKRIADTVENDVRQIILDVSQLPGDPADLDPAATLSSLGFNSAMCNDLAGRLDHYVKSVNSNANVSNAEITASMTVQQVIDLIKQKISQ